MNQYLDALVVKDPKRLPLSADVKYTEQEQVMAVGDGFWKTVTGRGNYNHYFADPVANQVGWMGTMRERGGVLLMSVRLRVQLGRITEIEKSFFRAGGGGPNNIAAMDKDPQPEALWLQPIPPAQRASRQQLINIANAYFEGVQKNDGKGFYPFTKDCDQARERLTHDECARVQTDDPQLQLHGVGLQDPTGERLSRHRQQRSSSPFPTGR
jgi:hypothetical protein